MIDWKFIYPVIRLPIRRSMLVSFHLPDPVIKMVPLLNHKLLLDLKLVHIQLTGWSLIIKNTILFNRASEPWPSHMMVINNSSGKCFSRCLGQIVHVGKFESAEDFKTHCESFVQRSVEGCQDSCVDQELDFETNLVKDEEDSEEVDTSRDPLEPHSNVEDLANSVLEEETLDLFNTEPEADLSCSNQSSHLDKSISPNKDKVEVEETIEELAATNSNSDLIEACLEELNGAVQDEEDEDRSKEEKDQENHEESPGKIDRDPKQTKADDRPLRYVCRICQSPFTTGLAMEAHTQEVHGVRAYQCHLCPKVFRIRTHMRLHLDFTHRLKYLNCGLCSKMRSESGEIFMAHMREIHPDVELACPICDRPGPEIGGTFEDHIDACLRQRLNENYVLSNCGGSLKRKFPVIESKEKKENEAPKAPQFKCRVCPTDFKTLPEMEDHMMNQHSTPAHQCAVCGAKRARIQALATHMDRVHGERKFNCLICGQTCDDSDAYFDHVKQSHPGESLTCPTCKEKPVGAESAEAFRRHYKNCSAQARRERVRKLELKKTFACDKCGLQFKNKQPFVLHMAKAHGAEFPHVCEKCEFKTTVEYEMKRHRVMHLRKEIESSGKTMSVTEDGQQLYYLCSECPAKYATQSGLNLHIRKIHTCVRYKCPHCDFTGRSPGMMQHHREKYHSTNPNTKCPECDYRGTPSRVKGHMKVHRAPQFKCHECGKMLKRPGALKEHLRIHTGEKPHGLVICLDW